MFSIQLIEQINLRFIKNNKIVPRSVVSEKHKEFIENELIKETSFLNKINPTISQRIYHVLNNITEIQRCSEGNITGYNNSKLGYNIYCSNQKCKCKKDYVTKRENTCIEKYGVSNPSKAEIIKDKKKETCQKNFGVDCNFTLRTTQDIINETNNLQLKDDFFNITNIQKFKLEVIKRFIPYTRKTYLKHEHRDFIISHILPLMNYLNIKDFQQVIYCIINNDYNIKTCNENNKVKFINLTQGYRQTCSNKECISCNTIRKDRISEKTKELHNNRTQIEKDIINKKRISTYYKKHGVYNPTYKHLKEILPLIKSDDFWKQFNSYIEIKEYFTDKVSPSSILNFTHKYRPDLEIYNDTISYPHKLINEFLNSLNIEYKINDRTQITPVELDVFIPKHKLAIEINGVYWHSENKGKDKKYHLNKLNKCIEKDIKLLHLTDIDILTKKYVVFNLIKNNLNLNKEIDIKDCSLIDLHKETSIDFINTNSILEYKESNIHKGLIYNNEIVSTITLKEIDIKKFEVTNFTNKIGYSIKNSISTLIQDIKGEFIVNVDRNYFSGNVFKELGWKLDNITQPDYYYTKDNILYHCNNLNNIELVDYNVDLTIDENMLNNGYNVFWNCGYKVFTYTNT